MLHRKNVFLNSYCEMKQKIMKIWIIFDRESLLWHFWQNTIIFFEYLDFCPNCLIFLPLALKLDNPYYHKQHSNVNKNVKLYRYLKVRNSDEKSKLLFNCVKFSYIPVFYYGFPQCKRRTFNYSQVTLKKDYF